MCRYRGAHARETIVICDNWCYRKGFVIKAGTDDAETLRTCACVRVFGFGLIRVPRPQSGRQANRWGSSCTCKTDPFSARPETARPRPTKAFDEDEDFRKSAQSNVVELQGRKRGKPVTESGSSII